MTKTKKRGASPSPPKSMPVEVLLEFYQRMFTIREFEETVYEVHSRGIMPGLAHLYIGEEAIAVGVCMALDLEDNITSTHRGHGHLLAKGGDPKRMFAELLGKAYGYNKGKGGSMHIADLSLGMLGANGIVGGGLGIATGAGLTAKVKGNGRVSVAFFGDGALNGGLFYETANMASLWELPVIYVLENNNYGEYTSVARSTAGTGPARAEAMNIPACSVDGNDVLAVYEAAKWGIGRARNGEGPSFIECCTYRLRGHHMGDQGNTYGYRSQSEVDEWMKQCPIKRLRLYMLERKLVVAEKLDKIEAGIKRMIEEAVKYAIEAPYPDPTEVYTDVYA